MVIPQEEARAAEEGELDARLGELRGGVHETDRGRPAGDEPAQDRADRVSARATAAHRGRSSASCATSVGSLFEAGMGAEAVQKVIEDRQSGPAGGRAAGGDSSFGLNQPAPQEGNKAASRGGGVPQERKPARAG